MAVDAVIVAFKIGLVVMDGGQRIAPSDTSDQSWSMTVANSVAAEAAVNTFCGHSVRDFSPNADGRSPANLAGKIDAAPDQQALH